MRAKFSVVATVVLAALGLVFACADAPSAPKTTPTDSTVAGGTDHDLLVALLAQVTNLQSRLDSGTRVAQQRFDSLTRLLDSLRVGGSQPPPVFSLEGEARVCGNFDFGGEAKLESTLSLWGGADGMLGADVYGNGAKGLVRGFATEDTKLDPASHLKLTVEVCGVGSLDGPSWPGGSAPARGASRSAATSGAMQTLLTNLLQSVTPDRLSTAASRLSMDASHLGAGIDAVSALSLSDLHFGQGVGNLLNALPLPSDIATLIGHPANVLQDAGDALNFAVDRVCDQTLFTGALAQRAADACNLRDQLPSASSLITILQGLNGLPNVLGVLQTQVSGACTAVNAMRPARVTIPTWDVTLPLGIGTVQVFPGYDHALFPGVAAIC